MKLVIFDDEEWFCKKTTEELKKFFREHEADFFYTLKSFTQPVAFEEWVYANHPDVVFIDISIPGNESYGIETAQKIRAHLKNAHIVFITSYVAKMPSAFSGLIRPSQFLIKSIKGFDIKPVIEEIVYEWKNRDSVIKVSFGSNEYVFNVEDIVYICKDKHKARIVLHNRIIETTNTLSSIAEHLPTHFVFADKGVIVNLKMVDEVNYAQKKLLFSNRGMVFMSRNAARAIKEALAELEGSRHAGYKADQNAKSH